MRDFRSNICGLSCFLIISRYSSYYITSNNWMAQLLNVVLEEGISVVVVTGLVELWWLANFFHLFQVMAKNVKPDWKPCWAWSLELSSGSFDQVRFLKNNKIRSSVLLMLQISRAVQVITWNTWASRLDQKPPHPLMLQLCKWTWQFINNYRTKFLSQSLQ